MKQITQQELIELIKEKQNNATIMEERLRIQATSKDDLDTAKKCFGEARAYQDLLCYLESVEIVEANKELGEEATESLKPKADITKDKLEGVWVLYSGVITEKDGNVYIDDGTKVYCFPKYSTTRDRDLKYYYQEQKPSQIVGADDQFREFLDSLDNETFCVNAKQVESISKEKRKVNKQYYVNIYLSKTLVVLGYDTQEEQEQSYNELKNWVKKWNQ